RRSSPERLQQIVRVPRPYGILTEHAPDRLRALQLPRCRLQRSTPERLGCPFISARLSSAARLWQIPAARRAASVAYRCEPSQGVPMRKPLRFLCCAASLSCLATSAAFAAQVLAPSSEESDLVP